MPLTINTLIPLITFIFYGVLYAITVISRSNTQVQGRKAFRFFLLLMLFWSLSAFFTFVDLNNTTFWMRALGFSAFGSSIALIRFVQVVLRRKWPWMTYVYLYGAVGLIVALFTDLLIKEASIQNGVLIYQFGPVISVLAISGYFFNLFGLFQLLRNFRLTEDLQQRNRMRYLILGVGIILIINLVNFTPLGKYPIDIAGNSLSAMAFAYAILRHQLLDIRVVIRKSLLYSIPTIMIGTGYFLIITLALTVFNFYSGLQIFGLSLLVAILTALLSQPLRDKAQSWIDRLFFREKFDSSQMLQRLSSNAATMLDLEKITNMILEEITTTLHIQNAAFFLKKDEQEGFFLSISTGLEPYIKMRLGNNHPIVMWLSNQNQELAKNDLEIVPRFKALWWQERHDLEQIDAELYIPLKVKGELVGIFVVGRKLSEENYSQDDILFLRTVANQTAVAIENARLYSAEQNRRKELGKLYSMSQMLVASDDVETVLKTITHYATESINVTFSKILIENDGGDYICRASYPSRDLGEELEVRLIDHDILSPFIEKMFKVNKPVILERSDPYISGEIKNALSLDIANNVCIHPLKVVDEFIGLLILGEERKKSREPFDSNKLQLISLIADQASSAIRRAGLHEQLEENFIETVVALANAVDARDTYTDDHSLRMENLAEKVSRVFGFSENEIQALRWAARLHDIGKIGISDGILNKPGPLSDEEWKIMRNHPDIGSDILAPIKKMTLVRPLIRSHHEKYDGTGYPDGLKGEEIPLGSRILSVVDSYVAITDNRVYRKRRSYEEALKELISNKGSQFDPKVVDVFIGIMQEQVKQEIS
jgi:HD-GYP domain-containing protein (c-di-GMP phosphodiesterase class II)